MWILQGSNVNPNSPIDTYPRVTAAFTIINIFLVITEPLPFDHVDITEF